VRFYFTSSTDYTHTHTHTHTQKNTNTTSLIWNVLRGLETEKEEKIIINIHWNRIFREWTVRFRFCIMSVYMRQIRQDAYFFSYFSFNKINFFISIQICFYMSSVYTILYQVPATNETKRVTYRLYTLHTHTNSSSHRHHKK
jgi:hypothetical protein